jgi:hypothetical protein
MAGRRAAPEKRKAELEPDLFAEAGQRLIASVEADYELSPAEVEILHQAAHTCDLVMVLESEIYAGSSLTVLGSTGQPRANPLLSTLAEQRRVLGSLLAQLDLPMPDQGAKSAEAQEKWRAQRRTSLGA